MSEIEKAAAEYTKKYNDGSPGEDATQEERAKYSCDGCGQNVKALKAAYLAGARKLLELAERYAQEETFCPDRISINALKSFLLRPIPIVEKEFDPEMLKQVRLDTKEAIERMRAAILNQKDD